MVFGCVGNFELGYVEVEDCFGVNVFFRVLVGEIYELNVDKICVFYVSDNGG